jgi:hypothetical protein
MTPRYWVVALRLLERTKCIHPQGSRAGIHTFRAPGLLGNQTVYGGAYYWWVFGMEGGTTNRKVAGSIPDWNFSLTILAAALWPWIRVSF